MKWTYITDDPATLPPMDTPVLVLFEDSDVWIAELAYADGVDIGWAICEEVKAKDGAWFCQFRQHIEMKPIAWHPLPELPTETKP
jgi:hypothetical protein